MTNTSHKTQFKGIIMLLLTALIWGLAFVAQSVGMENIEAFTFNGIRTFMGAFALLPVVIIRNHKAKKTMDTQALAENKKKNKATVKYGILIGIMYCIASNLQQFAFNYSTSGKIAFITALYMFFVPIFGLFIKKKVPLLTWICVSFGFVGLYFLCIDPQNIGSFNKGDILSVIASVFFAIHILIIEKYVAYTDGVALSCVQFFVCGIISVIMMFIFEEPRLSEIVTVMIPLLYAGVISCGIANTFQILGQRYTESTVASLIMCLESVFGVLAGAIILDEVLSDREVIGCVIMFVAIIVSQLSDKITDFAKKRKK